MPTESLSSQVGLALVDAGGRLIHSNERFETWMASIRALGESQPAREPANKRGAATARTLVTQLGLAPDSELARALASRYASEVVLPGLGEASAVHLALDPLVDGQRLLVVQSADERQSSESTAGSTAGSNGALEEELYRDELTGLGNRRRLEQLLSVWQPDGDYPGLTLLMLDLDRFKRVNDTLGHEVGDRLLKLVAERIRRSAREHDVLIRLGGDEFVIVQQHRGADENDVADRVAERIVDLLARPFLIEGQQINIGSSVGIAMLDPRTTAIKDLLRHADLALYAAKLAGRGTWRRFTPNLETDAVDRRQLELALRRAIPMREFELVYQPQVLMPEQVVTGFEALIRWNHPERGVISPVEFIPLAEEVGEIVAIGRWVLDTACKEASDWPNKLTVAVNVSPVQFEAPDFVETVRDALESSGLAPERLEIEITEGVLIDNLDRAQEHLARIRDMGVGVAMDDFGTGYSSLSYLNSLPFSKIKIDQGFVRGEQSDKSRALVHAILGLGESLGMKTLAEGVETRDQYDALANGGCTQAQGYLISRPLAASDVQSFLDQCQVTDSIRKVSNG